MAVKEQSAEEDSSSDVEQFSSTPVREPDVKRFRAMKNKAPPFNFAFDKK